MAQQRGKAAEAAKLARLSEDVERWRRTRRKLSPMPAPLWDATVAVAQRLGINRVKTVLGLNYRALKVRVAAANQPGGFAGAPSARFVELSGAQVLAGAAATGSVIEVANVRGDRLTVRLAAGAALDVASLVTAFRGESA